ncbi:MAG TPA: DUF2911 domain-containing protein [Gemmatimonadaceae bacterium]|nr:DUF2911 domain-containing protein [Gemmatimonadaceae bacterium]
MTRSLFTTVLLLSAASACGAQIYPVSQRASVTQDVAFTRITVDYGRPVARGRILFAAAGVVKWDRVWHPGADSATRVTLSRDITFEGRPLAAGQYTLWLIPREHEPWTLIVSRAAHVFHIPYPGESQDVMRLRVTPERGSWMESLAIYFPMVSADSAVMRIHWGETILPVRIKAPYRP